MHIVQYTHAVQNSSITIDKLQLSFTSLGLPQVLVSHNGPTFSSIKFKDFIKANGISHVKTVPYHPASNGLTEQAVQTIKSTLKKLTIGSLHHQVNSFCFKYCITPQTTTTSTSSAQLMMGCQLLSHLDLLLPW